MDERRLRQARLEARDQLEEAELATEELEAATRSLAEVCLGQGQLGATVVIELPAGSLSGQIIHVGVDLIRVQPRQGAPVDVVLGHVAGLRVVAEGTPRTIVSGHPGTFLARVRELVGSGEPVEIERTIGLPISGALHAVATDHVVVATKAGPWVVPLAALVSIRPC